MFPFRLFLLHRSCCFVQQLYVCLAPSPLPWQPHMVLLCRFVEVYTWAAKWLVLALPMKTIPALCTDTWPRCIGYVRYLYIKPMPKLYLTVMTKVQDLLDPGRTGSTSPGHICVPRTQLFQVSIAGLMLPGCGWRSGRIKYWMCFQVSWSLPLTLLGEQCLSQQLSLW